MLDLYQITGKLAWSHNLIVRRKIDGDWVEGREAVEQVFGVLIENLTSAVFFLLITLETLPVHFQSYR